MKIQLAKNLRREILRGHPWIYAKALKSLPSLPNAQLAQLADSKGEPLAWVLCDPHSPLAVRVLSLERKPPQDSFWQRRFQRALDLRFPLLNESTNCVRLFNGEGDLLPGLVCDLYDDTAVIQFDGKGPGEFWNRDQLCGWLVENTPAKTIVEKFRSGSKETHIVLAGQLSSPEIEVRENNCQYIVNVIEGQKTGFFLDQRENRHYVRSFSRELSVVNLFSYSGGFSIAAGLGGAESVTSVDISPGAIELAERNWSLNQLTPESHQAIVADVFEFLLDQSQTWDCVIVDPPSMAHSEKQKPQAINKYQELFSLAAKKVTSGGHLVLSSCSSHISFDDFFAIINESLSKARRRGQVLRISGQGSDHPFPHICPELRYLKFAHLALN
ncbi:MAG: class I SAM-dependent rRNA methyltransferase [Bdellovibrionaceae bacterium]|nr:class I SAM-dependent rRNA methyltransferase [Bdellovibrionales bacterium]MCB9085130.1 class I SAM-dependent rRNA methyltransferase [Pseudobdellovibrionaceae bacterium]